MSYFEKIQNALVAAARGATFERVTFDPNTGAAIVDGSSAALKTVLANELRAAFGTARVRSRQEMLREKQAWRWELVLQFESGQANAELFERFVTQKPLIIPSEDDGSERQVMLLLTDVDYVHPPQQGPTTGSRIRYVFEAELSPI